MVGIKLTAEEMRYITFFEKLTDARLHDCVISDDGRSIIFVVKKGDMGIAIGKNGSKIKKVQRAIGKSVQVIEHTDDLNEFLNNFLSPVKILEVNLVEQDGKRIAKITVEKHEKGMAIGARGRRIQGLKKLAERYFGLADVVIA
jgi:N utilization substance protein A